jgi:hypothetical protein
MKFIVIMILIILVYFLSAITHEADLSRNFKKDGDANCWFFEIKEK